MTRHGAFAGLSAALFAVGLGELVAAVVEPSASPFAVIGSGLIDLAPSWAKDTAIALFGTGDKVALLVGIAVVLAVVAALAGILELRRSGAGAVILGGLGALAVVAAMVRPGAGPFAWLPGLVAGLAAVIAVRVLIRRLRPVAGFQPDGDDRRRFLLWTAGAATVGLAALVVGNVARGATRSIEAVRTALRLPTAARPAAPVPAAAELDIPGLAPVVTPNLDFYRIDTALIVPRVDPADWSLRIHGMVDREVVVTWDELLALPLQESDVTLACVSNEVGGSLIGNARWLGHPIRDLLARAGVAADADMVLSTSADGFTASTPIEALTDDRDALLAIGMNGEALPIEHGFPARMVVPGLYGFVSATKWVTHLEVTRFDRKTAYWTTRGWSDRGPIKLQSRIDVPRGGTVAPGETVIAGMAWQQQIGIEAVEVRIDDGPWQRAELADAISADTWVQWSLPWSAASGRHTIECRAISVDGKTQTSEPAAVAPDGAQGWHRTTVTVT
ncbi:MULTISPECIES: molybdopterin-dependent oxidoreductase [unclassified Microbacterium]|uniref:molybdopterin-dependent oxidoreductase n=1 Tax=unclassified Microbacterium TaxID=2609290 RepID=UPI000EA9E8F8|nr:MULTISPECIES: molybdopterin-dependent oxidoreductase [unclassified Microbacterium]MBT2486849.1 molybdopterin-dependent oxidoreductase [Microbacterium sp. ISL-108]RKN64770.1 oxidoreductase [Microbacterium sp. CGR2]